MCWNTLILRAEIDTESRNDCLRLLVQLCFRFSWFLTSVFLARVPRSRRKLYLYRIWSVRFVTRYDSPHTE
jgi:hypothetical protein